MAKFTAAELARARLLGLSSEVSKAYWSSTSFNQAVKRLIGASPRLSLPQASQLISEYKKGVFSAYELTHGSLGQKINIAQTAINKNMWGGDYQGRRFMVKAKIQFTDPHTGQSRTEWRVRSYSRNPERETIFRDFIHGMEEYLTKYEKLDSTLAAQANFTVDVYHIARAW